jgi:hypothetical protein
VTDDHDEGFGELWKARERNDRQYLIRALVDPDYRVRAATFLGQLQAEEATEPLLRLLDANDPYVRLTAARSLGWIGAEEVRPRLRELALEDDDAGVRSWAVSALGDIGSSGDLGFLLPLLKDPSLRVRGSAALALGDLGDPQALGPLRRARRRLRRSPLEWYWHRGAYNKAIATLRHGSIDEDRRDRGVGPMKAALWVLALFVGYKILRFYVGFWVAAGLVAALVLVVLFFAFVDQAYKATYSRPPRRRRR